MRKIVLTLFFIVLIMFSIGCTDTNKTDTINDKGASDPRVIMGEEKTHTLDDDINVTYSGTSYINQYTVAKNGCYFLIATIEMNNTGNVVYNTSPLYWYLVSDGVAYRCDTATYSAEIVNSNALVGKGGKTTFQVVYQIQGDLSKDGQKIFRMSYTGV